MSDAEIYHYLLGEFEIGGMYRSPQELRPGDKNASFGVYEDQGLLKWHDFGLPREAEGKKAVDLLIEMRKVRYHDALKIIEREIATARIGKPPLQLKKTESYNTLPFIVYRDHNDYELQYWQRFGQTGFDLIYERIYGLDYMQYINNSFKIKSYPNDPAFVYVFEDNPLRCKLYRPYNQDYKFRMFNMSDVIEGWSSMIREKENLEGKLSRLFILSSTKDRLCWKKCCEIDESAINPTSEKIFRQIVAKKQELHDLSKEIVVIFDGDETGRQMAQQLSDSLDAKWVDVSKQLGYDDPKRDWVKDVARNTELFGIETLRKFKNKI